MTSQEYVRKIAGTGLTYKENQVLGISCQLCYAVIYIKSIKRQKLSAECVQIRQQQGKN